MAKSVSDWRGLARGAIATALLIGLLWLVQRSIGWSGVLAAWRHIPAETLVMAMALLVGAQIVRGLRLRCYLASHPGARTGPLIRISILHTAANNLLPMRLGEAALPLLLRPMGVGWSEGLVSLLWLRIFDLHALMSVALVFVTASRWGVQAVPVSLLIAAVILIASVALLRRVGRSGLGSRFRGLAAVSTVLHRPLARPFTLYLWTLLIWVLKWAGMVSLLAVLVPVSPLQQAMGVVAGELSSVLPVHGVAGAGTYEAAVVAGMGLSGAAMSGQLLAAAVNLHLFLLTVSVGLALLVYPFRGRRAPCHKTDVVL
ncbi:lysylphosphatidylglycerol synthase domain-containing protein [Algiphilus sp.]|uniref:lysylphosphatidylglycerol synthase transmembrane domain-containing protein n=1 Tax=Algiphilus sp. TaxID=1872431 RepID=UPI0032EEBA4E